MAEQLIDIPPSFTSEADRRTFQALRGRLWEYEPFRATRPNVELNVRDGQVQLSGRVRTLAMKEIVGYLCARVDGVGSVQNDLISDTEVSRQVADVLAADPVLGPLCIRVDVRHGRPTLSGDLPSAELEERAIDLAGQAQGVARDDRGNPDVFSELAVRPATRPPTAPPPKPPARSDGKAAEPARPVDA